MPRVRRRAACAALCCGVFLTTFLYRFDSLGGSLGGFSNDEFGYLARARQIQAGDVPFRDFNDPGWFLTDYLSAGAQWLGGYNLRSQALLTIGMLSIAAVLTFLLAWRAAGSLLAALLAVAIHIALEPRHYNYPKLVLYAAAIALAWAYVDRPTRPRLAALGAIVGVGFLFRHDHLLYLGSLGLMTVALVHRGSIRQALPAAARLSTVAALFVAPFFAFLALNGGIGEYFRLASIYVQRDAQRTSFSFPRLSFDSSRPLAAISGGGQDDGAAVNVRWGVVSEEQRRDREDKYSLHEGTVVEGTTWRYRLVNVSRSNIEALVRDPLVDDTSGIDRSKFLVASTDSFGLETQLDSVENATAFLYYAFLSLPLIAAAVLMKLQKATDSTHVMSSVAHIGPLLGLAVMLSAGFMSRGSTNIRIPDVGVTSAILLAWLIASVMGRDAPVVAARRSVRACVWVGAVIGLGLTVFSINGLAHSARTLRDTGFTSGPAGVAERAGAVWRSLGRHPSAFIDEDEQPGLLKIAGYVRACTEPGDRLFVLGVYPELYYFADRPFAGGHAWLLPLYYTDIEDEARIVARLKAARVPIVLTEDRSTYDREYRTVFEHVDKYLQDHYVDVGEIDIGGAPPLRALTRAGIAASGRYEPLGLPCFAAPGASSPP
jgi:hypothetical protein